MRDWANADANNVVATAAGELAGTTASATYGPPYNDASPGRPCSAFRCRGGAVSGCR
jgi:hypothetical protein